MIDYISALLIPFLGTVLGSAFVFFMKKEMPVLLQKTLLGFASGVMVAASVWSLLIPGIELEAESGKMAILPAIIGFLSGIGFLLFIDYITPHQHIVIVEHVPVVRTAVPVAVPVSRPVIVARIVRNRAEHRGDEPGEQACGQEQSDCDPEADERPRDRLARRPRHQAGQHHEHRRHVGQALPPSHRRLARGSNRRARP